MLLEARECCSAKGDSKTSDYYYCMVGAETPGHRFRGHFACQPCLKGWDRRDFAFLKEQAASNTPLGEQDSKRLQDYLKSDGRKKAATKGLRQRAVEQKGIEAVRLEERIRARPHNVTRQALS